MDAQTEKESPSPHPCVVSNGKEREIPENDETCAQCSDHAIGPQSPSFPPFVVSDDKGCDHGRYKCNEKSSPNGVCHSEQNCAKENEDRLVPSSGHAIGPQSPSLPPFVISDDKGCEHGRHKSTSLVSGDEGIRMLIQESKLIPNFAANAEGEVLPDWMWIDNSKPADGRTPYACKVCNCLVQYNKKRIEMHAKGRKHKTNYANFFEVCKQQTLDLANFLKDSFQLELIVLTKENVSIVEKTQAFLERDRRRLLCVASVIKFAKISGLCFFSEKVCVCLDRTLLGDLKGLTMLKSLLEGPVPKACADCWEIMMVIYDHYGIKCHNMVDMYGDDSEEVTPVANIDIHRTISVSAARLRKSIVDSIDAKCGNGLTFAKTPDAVLKHLCSLNRVMYEVYKEVDETNFESAFGSVKPGKPNKYGTKKEYAIECLEYSS